VAASDELLAIIRDEIRLCGPITFARYMELALYHPSLGYYRTRDPFGASGDFYTAEQLQPVFGELLATYVEQLSLGFEGRQPFSVLELGAGRGEMRSALARWNYRAVDWNSPQVPETWSGLVFANEFFDALPVNLRRRQGSHWQELFINNAEAGLQYYPQQVSQLSLVDYAHQYGSEIPDGGQLEVCPRVDEWLSRVATLLSRGRLLVIDYGYYMRELSRFPAGTLLAYHRHQAHADPLQEPGQRDITTHVNFTYFQECAGRRGLRLDRAQSLAQWALSVWEQPDFEHRWAAADPRWRLQWKQIVFGLGETFRVLQFHREC
jgi:SAM-dependent MidA family methyltransferase